MTDRRLPGEYAPGPLLGECAPAGPEPDYDFRAAVRDLMTEPRQVTAVARFTGGPGREREAAEAWAFELTCYFTRGVGEPPAVAYEDGTYTCTGIVQTTHPGDRPVTDFTLDEPWSLDFALGTDRQERLREMYRDRGIWYDGRDHGGLHG